MYVWAIVCTLDSTAYMYLWRAWFENFQVGMPKLLCTLLSYDLKKQTQGLKICFQRFKVRIQTVEKDQWS